MHSRLDEPPKTAALFCPRARCSRQTPALCKRDASGSITFRGDACRVLGTSAEQCMPTDSAVAVHATFAANSARLNQ